MCLSRLHRVVVLEGPEAAVVEEAGGRHRRVSLLALEGPAPRVGEWLVVHAGFAIGRASDEEARDVLADLRTVEDASSRAGA